MDKFESITPDEAQGGTTDASEDSNVDFEEGFYDLIDALEKSGEGLGKRWSDELAPGLASGDLEYEEAFNKLKQVIRDREVAKLRHNAPLEGGMSHEDIETLREYLFTLRSTMTGDNFLGNGAVAEVYSLSESEAHEIGIDDTSVCVKVILDDEKYREGNTVHEEADILRDLKNLEVKGVRTPKYIDHLSGGDFVGILMERIDGANLGRVLDTSLRGERDVLPESFHFESFFDDLNAYVEKMHDLGYYHLDLAARNVMVDGETGKPRVIDFGKAKYMPLSGQIEDEASRDFANIESTKHKLKKYLEEKSKESED